MSGRTSSSSRCLTSTLPGETARSTHTNSIGQHGVPEGAVEVPDEPCSSSALQSELRLGKDIEAGETELQHRKAPTTEPLPPGLYLVGTPIGNLEDITLRALRILRQASLILAEDTRHSAKLLRHYSIGTHMMSYHQFNSSARRTSVIHRLQAGEAIALISDAGMPAISDPGAELVQACVAERLPVTAVPGPSAVVAAVASSGFVSSREFSFLGFPPEKSSHRLKRLVQAATQDGSQVLYASPHKLLPLLGSCVEAFGGQRQCLIARELTKLHEELWRGSLEDAAEDFGNRSIKGEITIVIEGAAGMQEESIEDQITRESEMESRLRELMSSGVTLSESVKSVVSEFSCRRKDVYAMALKVKEATSALPLEG